MKAAIYCRLSAEDRDKLSVDEDSGSIQNQKAMLIHYASSNGWTMFEHYLLANPTDWNIYVALTAGRDLDGAYAEFYAYLIGKLFEAAPATFNFACRQMVPEQYVEQAVSHLAYYWEITPEEARIRLEEAKAE